MLLGCLQSLCLWDQIVCFGCRLCSLEERGHAKLLLRDEWNCVMLTWPELYKRFEWIHNMWHKFGLFLFDEHSVICAHTNRCQSSLYDKSLSVKWVKLDSGLVCFLKQKHEDISDKIWLIKSGCHLLYHHKIATIIMFRSLAQPDICRLL